MGGSGHFSGSSMRGLGESDADVADFFPELGLSTLLDSLLGAGFPTLLRSSTVKLRESLPLTDLEELPDEPATALFPLTWAGFTARLTLSTVVLRETVPLTDLEDLLEEAASVLFSLNPDLGVLPLDRSSPGNSMLSDLEVSLEGPELPAGTSLPLCDCRSRFEELGLDTDSATPPPD